MTKRGSPLLAAVELGGTKSIAVLARGVVIIERYRVATGEPEQTLPDLGRQLQAWRTQHGDVEALGIASFGPLQLDPSRDRYGCITQTPKPGWSGINLLDAFARHLAVPTALDTDVAAAALAEQRWGAGSGLDPIIYLTIGTGIGGGLIVGGEPVHGLLHPEMGHCRVRRDPADGFSGLCPFHGDCLEGLASGPAIAARAGAAAEALPPGHPIWRQVAGEVGELLHMLMLIASPQRIIIGGGVGLGASFLLSMIRDHVAETLADYLDGVSRASLDQLITSAKLGDDAGPVGGVALAARALRTAQGNTATRPSEDGEGR